MKTRTVTWVTVALALTLGSVSSAMTVNTNFTTGSGASTAWSTDDPAVGESCLEMTWPLSIGDNRAGVLISDLGGLTVADFNSWSYWAKGLESSMTGIILPAFTVCVDTDEANYEGEDFDTYVCVMPNSTDENWHNITSSSSLAYAVEYAGTTGPSFSSPTSWTAFKACLDSDDLVRHIRIDAGGSMTWDNVAYVDDIVLNGNTTTMEVPEPATMGLLALGGLAVLRRRRKA